MSNTLYLLLGSNMGDKLLFLAEAREHISKEIGHITKCSSVYLTEAWGVIGQDAYMNQALKVDSNFSADSIITYILEIERIMGRMRKKKNEPRTIDIDILFFNNQIINTPRLTIPHPRIHERRFALEPMNEISPGYIHPVLDKTISELLAGSDDRLHVKKI